MISGRFLPRMLHTRPAAELMATFGLVFIGCGAMALNQAVGGRLTGLGVAAAWGVAILGMVFAFGNVRNRGGARNTVSSLIRTPAIS